jgi:drug/metabolite transporter (DMT)-like permease
MAINETIDIVNQTIAGANVTAQGGNLIISRFTQLVTAPYTHQDMIWIVLPLIISFFIMQLYFGRYKKEHPGWECAVGHCLTLMFVSFDLIRQIYKNAPNKEIITMIFSNYMEFIVVLFVLSWGAWFFIGDFFHLISKKLAFLFSSSTLTTVMAYVGIVVIYTKVPIDFATIIASLMLLILLSLLIGIIHLLEPISLRED